MMIRHGNSYSIHHSQQSTVSQGEPIICAASKRGDRGTQQDFFTYAAGLDSQTIEKVGVLCIVCDGMGGLPGGNIASKSCAQAVLSEFYRNSPEVNPLETLVHCVNYADNIVSSIVDDHGMLLNCGTTLVAALIKPGKAFWVSVGDSRIYLIRNRTITRLTRDHCYSLALQQMVENGTISQKDADDDLQRSSLISYIGRGNLSLLDMDSICFSAEKGDRLLLCTDGITKILNDDEILAIVNSCSVKEQAICLVTHSVGRDDMRHDNTTALVITA